MPKRKRKPVGVYIDSHGYPRISMGKMRGKYLHTIVAEGMLGRELTADEIVHHKDEDKRNYHWSNLQVMGFREHNCHTAKQYWAMRKRDKADRKLWEEWNGEGSTAKLVDQHDTSFNTEEFY
jgi:hypothetical protein